MLPLERLIEPRERHFWAARRGRRPRSSRVERLDTRSYRRGRLGRLEESSRIRKALLLEVHRKGCTP
jgi:hypothetical protein